jgi:DNA-nicking Smr family endonuclease
MTRKAEKALSDEDRVLWNRVAKTTSPLRGRGAALIPEAGSAAQGDEGMLALFDAADMVTSKTAMLPTRSKQQRAHPFDAPTHSKLSKGRLPLEGRVDLHGMTQAEAHTLLFSFLHRAYAEGLRYVLVITGKGSSFGSDGILRRAVPEWLATHSFRLLVSSYDNAARHHGGSGALYIRLRRRSGGKSP